MNSNNSYGYEYNSYISSQKNLTISYDFLSYCRVLSIFHIMKVKNPGLMCALLQISFFFPKLFFYNLYVSVL